MATLLLSGTGGSANWLPLILPLAAVALVLYATDMVIKLVKKRKLHRSHMAGEMEATEHFDDHNSLTWNQYIYVCTNIRWRPWWQLAPAAASDSSALGAVRFGRICGKICAEMVARTAYRATIAAK